MSQCQSHGCVLRIRLLLEHVFSSVRMNSRYQALFLSTHQEPRYEAKGLPTAFLSAEVTLSSKNYKGLEY